MFDLLLYIIGSLELASHSLNLLLIELYLILTLFQLSLLGPDPLVLVAVFECDSPSDAPARCDSVLLRLLLPVLVNELLQLRGQHLQLILQLLILTLQLRDEHLFICQSRVRVVSTS